MPLADLALMLGLFRRDQLFRSFLSNTFLERLNRGEPINSQNLIDVVLNTLDLTDQRVHLINFMLNSEHFYATRVGFKIMLL